LIILPRVILDVAFPAKLGVVSTNFGGVACQPWGIYGVAQETPLFLSPQEFQLLTLIAHHLQPPNHQKQTMSEYFSNNTNALNTINVSNKFTVADGRANILAWLSPLDPTLRHHDI